MAFGARGSTYLVSPFLHLVDDHAMWGFCPSASRRCIDASSSRGVGLVRWGVGGGRLMACDLVAIVFLMALASGRSSQAQATTLALPFNPGRFFWTSRVTSRL